MKFPHRRRSRSLYHHAFHVYRDWLYFLVIMVVLAVAAVLFHLYLFLYDESMKLSTDTSPVEQVTVNREAMKKVLEVYAIKEQEFELKRQTVPVAVDPAR